LRRHDPGEVVSVARPGHMIIEAGQRRFLRTARDSSEVTFGHVVEAPGARFHKMNEEHGFRRPDGRRTGIRRGRPRACHSQSHLRGRDLHERVYGLRGGQVVETWNVDARASCNRTSPAVAAANVG